MWMGSGWCGGDIGVWWWGAFNSSCFMSTLSGADEMKLRANGLFLQRTFVQLGSKRVWLAVLASAASLLLAASALPQGIATGSISGTIADPSGAVVPGAKVTAVNGASDTASTAQTTTD